MTRSMRTVALAHHAAFVLLSFLSNPNFATLHRLVPFHFPFSSRSLHHPPMISSHSSLLSCSPLPPALRVEQDEVPVLHEFQQLSYCFSCHTRTLSQTIRWQQDEKYRNSQRARGLTEEYCRYLDYLATIDISYTAPWHQRHRYESTKAPSRWHATMRIS